MIETRSLHVSKRYPIIVIDVGYAIRGPRLLMIGVLAQLAGQESSRGMAHWAKLRRHEWSQLFHLKRESLPHSSTWSRVLGHGVKPHEVEESVGQFLAQALRIAPGKRGSIQLASDGKTRRGTIPSSRNGRRA